MTNKSFHKKDNVSSCLLKYILPGILILLGLFLSYKGTFTYWHFDSDAAAIPVLLSEINQHGWSFIQTFRFPIDNFLFPHIFLDKIFFDTFGMTPDHAVLTGVLFFWGSVLIASILTTYLTDISRGMWCAAILLNASKAALANGGYLTYPIIGHVASLMWGFTSIFLILMAFKKNISLLLLPAFLLLFPASFSDPWLLPTFVLPCILSAAFITIVQKKAFNSINKILISIIILGIICLIFTKTKFFGGVNIKSENSMCYFHINPSIHSLYIEIISLSKYFNFIPLWDSHNYKMFFSYSKRHTWSFIATSINFIILAIIFVKTSFPSIQISLTRKNYTKSYFLIFLWFSVMGILSSGFIFDGIPSLESSRYMENIFYCIVLLFLLSNNEFPHHISRKFIYTIGVLYFSSSFVSNYTLVKEHQHAWMKEDLSLISIMNDKKIEYVFGSYWGLDTHFLTVMSGGKIKFRPLNYSPNYHGFLPSLWSSPSWYKVPEHKKWAFVLRGAYEGGVCAPFPTCDYAVINQFGKPVSVEHEGIFTIFTYESNEGRLPYDSSEYNWGKALPLSKNAFSSWKTFYPSYELNTDNLILLAGWNDIDPDGSVESKSPRTELMLPVLDSHQKDMQVRFKISTAGAVNQTLKIDCNGEVIAHIQIDSQINVREFTIPLHSNASYVKIGIDIEKIGFDIEKFTPITKSKGFILYNVQIVRK